MASFLASRLLLHLLHLPRVPISPLSGPSGLGRDNNYFCWLLFPLLKGGPWGFKAFLYFCAYLGATQIYRGSCFKGNIRYTRWKVRGSLQSLDLRHKSMFTVTWRRQQPPPQAIWVCGGPLGGCGTSSWPHGFRKSTGRVFWVIKQVTYTKLVEDMQNSDRYALLDTFINAGLFSFIAFFIVCNNIFIGKFIYFLFFFLDWKNP